MKISLIQRNKLLLHSEMESVFNRTKKLNLYNTLIYNG